MKYKLFKINARGKKQLWIGEIEGNEYCISYGQEGGKMQKKCVTVSKGKNIGRSNETTPAEQALADLQKEVRKKTDGGYTTEGEVLVLGTVNTKQVKDVNFKVPAPMLANDLNKHFKKIENKQIFVQPKLDGFRAIYDRKEKKLYSRSRKPLIGVDCIIPNIEKALSKFTKDYRYFDGELCSDILSFNEISSLVSPKKTPKSDELQKTIKFYVFDIINDHDFTSREEAMRRNFQNNENAIRVKSFFFTANKIEDLPIQKFIDEGNEGIMIRIPDSLYEGKRSMGLFKYKLFDDCEAKCIGFNAQENDENKLGSIQFVMKDGTEFDARPALTDEEKQEIWDNQKEYLGRIANIKYQSVSEYGVPRFPVMKFWRESWDL